LRDGFHHLLITLCIPSRGKRARFSAKALLQIAPKGGFIENPRIGAGAGISNYDVQKASAVIDAGCRDMYEPSSR
jgi:hypothetical protein